MTPTGSGDIPVADATRCGAAHFCGDAFVGSRAPTGDWALRAVGIGDRNVAAPSSATCALDLELYDLNSAAMKTRPLLTVLALISAAAILTPGSYAKEKEKKKDSGKKQPSTVDQLWQLWQQKNPGVVTPAPEPPPPVNPEQQVRLQVINNTGQPVSLVWIQPYAGAQNYGALPPDGQARVIGTYPGHVWVFKIGNQVIQRYQVTDQAGQELTFGRRGGADQLPLARYPTPPQLAPSTRRGVAPAVSDRAAFLKVHNDARAAKGVEPLLWNADCATAAQEWAQRLADTDTGLAHSRRQGFGESVWQGSGGSFKPADAAYDWYSEISEYHGEPIDQNNYRNFGHYTQMVWSGTTGVGYGVARSASGNIYIVANYWPPGNFLGQKPYRKH